MDTFVARTAALQLVQDALLSSANSEAVRNFIQDLPVLAKEQIPLEDNCPICLLPFLEILENEEASGEEEGGVTKLEECGHIFCRRDLVEWIRTLHLNCPTCRFQFIQISTYQDDASSDGGEYLPSSEGEEDIEVDANASELADFPAEDRYDAFAPDWEDEVESSSAVDPQLEEYEAMTEAWMGDYDSEYGDVDVEGGGLDFEPEYMEEGLTDPELDPMIEDAGNSNFEPGLDEVIEPEFDPAIEDDSWDPPEFVPAEDDGSCDAPAFNPAEEDGSCDPPEFDPAERQDEAQDEYFDLKLAMDQSFEDVEDPGEALGGIEDNYPLIESFSDPEQEV